MQEVDISIPHSEDLSVSEAPITEDVYVFPASLEQHRYWILDQVDPESTASNMAIAFRLEGEVSDAIAEQSIRELTLRHEALRTTFRMVNGELMQVISEEPNYRFSVSDLRGLPEKIRTQRAEELIREHSHVVIDMAAGPLFHARLIHVSDKQHFLAFTIHHIVCDGWSNGILVRDFAQYYSALARGTEPALPELPFQFADFTEWQKEWLTTDDAQQALTFWKDQIRRNVPALDLPCDRPRGSRKDGPGNIESQLISPELNERLRALCRTHDATMHQMLLAAFQALLSRYTGQSEFLLGSSIANRTQAGMENVVGRFANPQVILANVEGNPTFRELLARVIEWSSRAYAHQDLPFSRLMEEFQLELTGATSQFLQAYFVYQRAFMQPQQAGSGLKITPRPSVSGGVNFDMLVSVVERAEGPRIQIEYNTDLFTQERVRDFIGRFVRTIEAVTQNSSLRVSELQLLSREEEAELSSAGGGETFTAARGATLLSAFDEQAQILGDEPAIGTSRGRISWKVLREESLRYATALRGRGVGSGQAVALRMERTPEAAAIALGILRAGAAVMPVPVAATAEEWNRILAELQPFRALASEAFSRTVGGILSFEALKKTASAAGTAAGPSPSDAAIHAITLDSVERHRVSATSHESVLQLMCAAGKALQIQARSKVLVLPADTAIDTWADLFLPLVNGASVFFSSEKDGVELRKLASKERFEVALGMPSDWLSLLASGWTADVIPQVVSRGDRLPSSVASRLRRAGQCWSLFSSPLAGGPIGIASLRSNPEAEPGPALQEEWRLAPLPGSSLTVRDQAGNLSLPGVTGEICLHRSDWTVPLRLGYLARYSSRTGFVLLESIERSVRISGYQVRLGELEDRLMSHPEVVKARASVQKDRYGNPGLLAYVAAASPELQRDALSAYLRAHAPEYLSRAEITVVKSIPCHLNGAPNLLLLPRPESSLSSRVDLTEVVPPSDDLEAKLLTIWEEVLGVQGIGIRNSFFSLGGYSLLIVRLFARMNKALGTSLPITTIFNAPTIEQLAEILRGKKAYSALVPVQTSGGRPPFFLVHSYLLYAGLPSVLGKDHPFYGLRELDNEGEMTIEQRVRSYVEAMRSIQPHGPYHIGGWCAAGPLTVEMARQLTMAGEKVAIVVLFDSWRPGYAEEVNEEQARRGEVNWWSRNRRKYSFHTKRLRALSSTGKLKYLWLAGWHKVKSGRDELYLRNWATVRWLSRQFGFALPHFMHNISLDTLNSVAKYRGEPFPCRITLMRATESHHIPGAEPACGWGTIATEGVEVVWAPGNHESMFQEPNLSIVGKMLAERLDRAHQQAR